MGISSYPEMIIVEKSPQVSSFMTPFISAGEWYQVSEAPPWRAVGVPTQLGTFDATDDLKSREWQVLPLPWPTDLPN